ncbi:MAG: hypothetical protein H6Q69_300 [Firmicutes bacterium]|nr:hypothetical protein [Bacillota bacterium]
MRLQIESYKTPRSVSRFDQGVVGFLALAVMFIAAQIIRFFW